MKDRANGWVALAGIGLVALGAWILLERVFVPVFAPLGRVFEGVAHLGWPLLLIAAGLLLLTRRRPAAYTGSLRRSRSDRMIGGVVGGLSRRFGVEPTIGRIAFVVIAVVVGVWPAILFYAIALAVVPEEDPVWVTASSAQTPPAPPAP